MFFGQGSPITQTLNHRAQEVILARVSVQTCRQGAVFFAPYLGSRLAFNGSVGVLFINPSLAGFALLLRTLLSAFLAACLCVVSANLLKTLNAPTSFSYAIATHFKLACASNAALNPKLPTDARSAVVTATARFASAVRQTEHVLANVCAREWGFAKICFFKWVCHFDSPSQTKDAKCSGVPSRYTPLTNA